MCTVCQKLGQKLSNLYTLTQPVASHIATHCKFSCLIHIKQIFCRLRQLIPPIQRLFVRTGGHDKICFAHKSISDIEMSRRPFLEVVEMRMDRKMFRFLEHRQCKFWVTGKHIKNGPHHIQSDEHVQYPENVVISQEARVWSSLPSGEDKRCGTRRVSKTTPSYLSTATYGAAGTTACCTF